MQEKFSFSSRDGELIAEIRDLISDLRVSLYASNTEFLFRWPNVDLDAMRQVSYKIANLIHREKCNFMTICHKNDVANFYEYGETKIRYETVAPIDLTRVLELDFGDGVYLLGDPEDLEPAIKDDAVEKVFFFYCNNCSSADVCLVTNVFSGKDFV